MKDSEGVSKLLECQKQRWSEGINSIDRRALKKKFCDKFYRYSKEMTFAGADIASDMLRDKRVINRANLALLISLLALLNEIINVKEIIKLLWQLISNYLSQLLK